MSIAASAWPIANDWLVGRAAFDHLHYHLPAIQRFVADWPAVDLVDYASATTPGYHLVCAGVGRLGNAGPVALRWIGLAFTLGLVGSVGGWLAARRGWTAAALVAPLLGSLYVYSSGVWLLPDNAGWLGVWAVLVLALRRPIRLWGWLALMLALVLTVLMRQIQVWTLGPVIVAAWLDAKPARDHPPMSLREVGSVLAPTPRRIVAAIGGVLVGGPALVLLAVLYAMWGGLVPPRFASFHASNFSPAAAALFLSLIAGFGVFFVGWWWKGFTTLVRARRALLFAAVTVGLLAALVPHTDYSLEGGRYGALWTVGAKLPTLMHRSLLLACMAPAGAVVLASWLSLLDARARWVLLASCAGFVAASSMSSIAGQRYYEPMVLMLIAVLAGTQPERTSRAGIVGPALAGMLLAGLTVFTLARSGSMDYPEDPRGTQPFVTPIASPAAPP
ncbi:MAG: hypothetical protein KDB18_09730 [Salinibacterium sp.]|nr:hypothetical protein [Salinibacterium sp.]